MSSRAAVTAVIAAAGSGERLGAGGPKAFVPLAGRPLVEWSIDAFRAAGSVASIVVACPPGHAHDFGPLAGGGEGAGEGLPGLATVEGGATRAESVANALATVETELVAVHDAARPLVTPDLIEAVVATLAADPDASGAIAATPVTDTIKRVPPSRGSLVADGVPKEPREVGETLDRAQLWAAQTPQVFRTAALRAALEVEPGVRDAATDESMLVEAAGGRVLIQPSSPRNLKVTTPLDLELAGLLLTE